MLTRGALAELSDSLGEQNVLSIYLDGRVTDPAARLAWRSTLRHHLSTLRDKVAERAERRDFDRCVEHLEQELAAIGGALSAAGYVAFVTVNRVELAEKLPVEMPNVARWRRGPWVSPYLRAQKELRPLVLAVVDARSARSYRYAQGTLIPLEHFHAHVQIDEPIHMGKASRPNFHSGTRGATTTDAMQRAHEHGTQRMLRELIEHLMKVAPDDEWIVIGGMPLMAGSVLTMLPASARQRAIAATGLSAITAASTLRRVAREQARQLRQRLDRQLVEMAIDHAAERGRGSTGEAATRAALEMKDVHMLLMSTRFLSDRAEGAEELVQLALAGKATIEVVSPPAADRLDRAGGVSGILRYATSGTSVEAEAAALG